MQGSPLLGVENGLHIVHALVLAHHEFGGGHRAVGQHGPGAGLVLQHQSLGAGADVDLVNAHHIALQVQILSHVDSYMYVNQKD